MKHVFDIEFFKSGTGFVAKCSCGKKLGRPTGCNRAGIDYAMSASRSAFLKHCAAVGAEPLVARWKIYHWMKDLAGDPNTTLRCIESE